jgi:hypothetical protein
MEVMPVGTNSTQQGETTLHDYSTMPKNAFASEIDKVFGQARPYVERGDAIPKDVWFSVQQTVSGLCQRVGIEAPNALSGFPTSS